MKIIITLFFFITLLILSSCASSKRFTSEKDKQIENEENLSELNLELLERGIASYYADQYHGKKTASGEIYNMNDLTAAHPTLPFGVLLLVKNLKNNRTVIVRVNDRMPDFKGRVIDLSLAAAKKLDMISDGIVEVKIYRLKK
ncbi:septal ring lytic transglycosylase RlpA family protein [Ignavibacterium sp.]|uniref:septal ring lytic transglycosylase RlpA family protein n=1 Tax=Ignavibacterium sp. TaxID=2651167 RepID=UPI00307EFA99